MDRLDSRNSRQHFAAHGKETSDGRTGNNEVVN